MDQLRLVARVLAGIWIRKQHPTWPARRQRTWAQDHWRSFLPHVTDDMAARTDRGKQDLIELLDRFDATIHAPRKAE